MKKPVVYCFNPTCELAVANGSFSYMPPSNLLGMEHDLELLPYIYAGQDDIVVTQQKPSAAFQEFLTKAGFKLPGFSSLTELDLLPGKEFQEIRPWGWSPAVHHQFKNLKEHCSPEFINSPVFSWTSHSRALFERESSLKLLHTILSADHPGWMISRHMTGKKISDIQEIELWLKTSRSLVLKAPISSSGRGVQILRNTELNKSNREWISGILNQQKYLIAEPLLHKKLDFSFQFFIRSATDIEFLGISFFETNTNGQYIGTYINADISQIFAGIEAGLFDSIIQTTSATITDALKQSDYSRFYRGYLGIDAMLFEDQEQIKIQPCIEVNCRMNMGILTLFLEKRIDPDSSGMFRIHTGKEGEFSKFAADQQKKHPLQFNNGKISSGFLPLTEPDQKKKFGAYSILAVAR